MLPHVLREYHINKILLSQLGLWPFQNKFVRIVLPICHLVFAISFYPFLILILYDHWENTQMMFEICYQIVLLTIFVAKLVNELWNHKIRCLCEAIEDHWNIFTSKFEVQILKDYSIISRKFTIFYTMLMYSMVAIFILIPLTPIFLDVVLPLNESRPRLLAISFELRIDKDKYFVHIFCYSISIIIIGVIIMVAVDTMHVTCTTHACSLFSIIGRQLEIITSKLYVDINDNRHEYYVNTELLDEQVIYEEFITCLKKYQLALKFVDVLNSAYQILSLLLLLLTGTTISLVGMGVSIEEDNVQITYRLLRERKTDFTYLSKTIENTTSDIFYVLQIVYVLDQIQEVMRFAFIIVGMLTQLFIMCYFGQMLIDESENIFRRVYAAKWYNFSPRLKSLLIITLYRSFVPCNLIAGNIYSLSMTTYAAVIRAGISYFMTFLSIKE